MCPRFVFVFLIGRFDRFSVGSVMVGLSRLFASSSRTLRSWLNVSLTVNVLRYRSSQPLLVETDSGGGRLFDGNASILPGREPGRHPIRNDSGHGHGRPEVPTSTPSCVSLRATYRGDGTPPARTSRFMLSLVALLDLVVRPSTHSTLMPPPLVIPSGRSKAVGRDSPTPHQQAGDSVEPASCRPKAMRTKKPGWPSCPVSPPARAFGVRFLSRQTGRPIGFSMSRF